MSVIRNTKKWLGIKWHYRPWFCESKKKKKNTDSENYSINLSYCILGKYSAWLFTKVTYQLLIVFKWLKDNSISFSTFSIVSSLSKFLWLPRIFLSWFEFVSHLIPVKVKIFYSRMRKEGVRGGLWMMLMGNPFLKGWWSGSGRTEDSHWSFQESEAQLPKEGDSPAHEGTLPSPPPHWPGATTRS